MRLLSCMLLICAGLAADEPAKPASSPAAAQAKKPPAALAVPADAVQISPGLYRWQDKDGKSWMYRRSPFGVSRWEEGSADAKQKSAIETTMAVEQGESIRFERDSPFGKHVWVRKKTELDETEQKIWEHQQEKIAASRKAEKE